MNFVCAFLVLKKSLAVLRNQTIQQLILDKQVDTSIPVSQGSLVM